MTTSRGARIAGWLGLALHLLALVWYAASGLVAPAWAVVGLLVIWAVVLVAAIRVMRTRPLLVAFVPLLDVAIWFAVIWAGETFLDWTA